ncbi:MAG: hypothetical protein Q9M39_03175 [Sulfurovum sp.]|nr:hypothetical protein [Sulfurovum sp.]
MKSFEYLKELDNFELYLIPILLIFTIWFILDTVKYYKGEKRNIKYLHKFAKEGEVEAQKHLAKRYYEGNMVKKSFQRASFWSQKASFSAKRISDYKSKIFLNITSKNKKY